MCEPFKMLHFCNVLKDISNIDTTFLENSLVLIVCLVLRSLTFLTKVEPEKKMILNV